ncbi:NUDIX hydrolase [Alkalihalobacillus trypoxylicola]|uniref:DNA mismatch repair protein MutT n=1 Tax=Alkalihalobacillus trypoxylicola TaxID=519424 RepID=A0A162FCJ6_9BACI|nr:NUDIX domain-containing protein [Alkalihalobacillus trypoxylicola]KYG35292.1 DNA mismatch repair protein MutT [Alkalihalobacillus trypoxylicola]
MFIVNVEGAILKKDKWLIIERSIKETHAAGLLSLVGGKVEMEGNFPSILERTLKREINEEVDIKVKEPLKYVHSTSFISDTGESVVDIVFLCEYDNGKAIAKSTNEVESVHWMTAQQVFEHPNAPDYLKESIKRAEKIKCANFA